MFYYIKQLNRITVSNENSKSNGHELAICYFNLIKLFGTEITRFEE